MKHLLFATSAIHPLSGVCFAPADGSDAGGAAVADAAPAAAKARQTFSPEQIASIRAKRAEVHPEGHEKAGKPVYSHAKLADEFGTNAGTISMIVRNRTYKNPEYTPVNDTK